MDALVARAEEWNMLPYLSGSRAYFGVLGQAGFYHSLYFGIEACFLLPAPSVVTP